MDRSTEIELMRLLHGELPPERARALESRFAAEPELAGAYRRLRERWEGLELPPPSPVPLGFSGRVPPYTLEADTDLHEYLGPEFMKLFAAVKRHEIDKAQSALPEYMGADWPNQVTDWELEQLFEYL